MKRLLRRTYFIMAAFFVASQGLAAPSFEAHNALIKECEKALLQKESQLIRATKTSGQDLVAARVFVEKLAFDESTDPSDVPKQLAELTELLGMTQASVLETIERFAESGWLGGSLHDLSFLSYFNANSLKTIHMNYGSRDMLMEFGATEPVDRMKLVKRRPAKLVADEYDNINKLYLGQIDENKVIDHMVVNGVEAFKKHYQINYKGALTHESKKGAFYFAFHASVRQLNKALPLSSKYNDSTALILRFLYKVQLKNQARKFLGLEPSRLKRLVATIKGMMDLFFTDPYEDAFRIAEERLRAARENALLAPPVEQAQYDFSQELGLETYKRAKVAFDLAMDDFMSLSSELNDPASLEPVARYVDRHSEFYYWLFGQLEQMKASVEVLASQYGGMSTAKRDELRAQLLQRLAEVDQQVTLLQDITPSELAKKSGVSNRQFLTPLFAIENDQRSGLKNSYAELNESIVRLLQSVARR